MASPGSKDGGRDNRTALARSGELRRRGQFDAARQQTNRRRFAGILAPSVSDTTSAQAVVLQKDFLNVAAQPTNSTEVTVTRDSDGGMRFYAAGTAVRVLATEVGNPVRTIGTSSTAEATWTSLTVPANTLGTAGMVIIEAWGDMLNNSGSTINSTWRVKLGATTQITSTTSGFATSATRRPINARFIIASRGTAGTQQLAGHIYMGIPSTAGNGIGGYGEFRPGDGGTFGGKDGISEDSTTALALAITHQFGTSSASAEMRLFGAKLTYFP